MTFIKQSYAFDAHHFDQKYKVTAHFVHPITHLVDAEVFFEVINCAFVHIFAPVNVRGTEERFSGSDVVLTAFSLWVCTHFKVFNELMRFV